MRYESEILYDLMKRDGLLNPPQNNLPYESELKEKYINDVVGAYPKLNDYRGEWLNYAHENGIIGEFPYVTLTDVTNATIDNVVPYAYQSAILKGNTIINLVNNFTFGSGVEETDNYFTLTQTNTTENIGVNIETSLIELNKDYTLIYFIQEKTTTNATSLVIKQASYLAPSENATITQNIGWNKVKFNLSSFGSNRGLNIAIASSEQDGNYIKFAKKKFPLLAGDWTQKELPFDTINYGMQSVKMPVLTTFSYTNLINENDKTFLTPYLYPNKLFYKSTTSTHHTLHYYNADKVKIGDSGDEWSAKSQYQPPYGTVFVKMDYTADTRSPMLAYNNEETYKPFTPIKSNILTVNEDVELRGVGDVKDTLDCLTGEVTQRIDEIVLDGDENWESHAVKTNTIVFKLLIGKLKHTDHHIISDRFPTNAPGDVEKITNTGNIVYLAILRTKADNLNDFKSYLSQNPITVQYQLAKESTKTVDLKIINQDGENVPLKPIEGTMHLTTSSETINPLFSGEIPVEAIEQNLASFTNLEGVEHNE